MVYVGLDLSKENIAGAAIDSRGRLVNQVNLGIGQRRLKNSCMKLKDVCNKEKGFASSWRVGGKIRGYNALHSNFNAGTQR